MSERFGNLLNTNTAGDIDSASNVGSISSTHYEEALNSLYAQHVQLDNQIKCMQNKMDNIELNHGEQFQIIRRNSIIGIIVIIAVVLYLVNQNSTLNKQVNELQRQLDTLSIRVKVLEGANRILPSDGHDEPTYMQLSKVTINVPIKNIQRAITKLVNNFIRDSFANSQYNLDLTEKQLYEIEHNMKNSCFARKDSIIGNCEFQGTVNDNNINRYGNSIRTKFIIATEINPNNLDEYIIHVLVLIATNTV